MSKSEKVDQGGEGAAVKPKGEKQSKAKAKAKPKRKPSRRLPPYNVVLLNDDDHTYEYVIEMLGKLFGHDEATAFKMAEELDTTGRVIVLTTHKEKGRAEARPDHRLRRRRADGDVEGVDVVGDRARGVRPVSAGTRPELGIPQPHC